MTPKPANSARIYDFAAHRMARIARQRRLLGTSRRFLWSWPETGQTLAVDFPLSAAVLSSQVARA
ncbi:MAG: hypothetical protein WDO72_02590 [Pseudomonadota bacterium]